jgi:hypothetical protein
MTRADVLLDRMRRNPNGNWQIADVKAVCSANNVRFSPPSGGGSHWKVSHPTQRDILTIPQRKPIKPVYIRLLVRFINAVHEATK